MAQHFGQSVVVDNKPGTAGLIAGEAVVKSTPDVDGDHLDDADYLASCARWP